MNPFRNKKSEIFADTPKASRISNGMRVLIGTPIHVSKDYSMERWLKNVAAMEYPADLLLVDNSPGLDYVEKVKGYCKKYKIMNYTLKHLELPSEQKGDERIARSREIIRKEILSHDYDCWFDWESDQIIPADAPDKLVKIMEAGNCMMIVHNNGIRQIPGATGFDLGIALVKRECLKKYSFILEFGTDPDMPDNWDAGDQWYKKRLLRDGGSYIDAIGVFGFMFHLDK